jgi:hypothetical protein
MKRSLLIVIVAGITVSAGAWLYAQSAKAPEPGPAIRNPVPIDASLKTPSVPPSAKPEEFTSTPPLKTTTVEAINLRNRFIELSKKKAQLMKEPQLKREIEALEREIPELEAWARAQEAVEILRDVIEKHPNTKAAQSANAAIRLIQERGDARFIPGTLERAPVPVPGDSFRPRFEGEIKPTPHDSGPSPFGSDGSRPAAPGNPDANPRAF